MPRDDSAYTGHMLDMARKAIALAQDVSKSEFDRDETLQLALTHILQVIGEAARRVTAEYREAHPEIPWSAIVGMRHKVVHDYFSVDYDIVWDTVVTRLPPLVATLERFTQKP